MPDRQVRVDLTVDDQASKPIAKVAGEVEQLEQAAPEIRLSVEDTAAKKDLDGFLKKVEGLDAETATIVLAVKGAEAQKQIAQALTDVARLDASDPLIDVKLADVATLRGDLEQIEAKVRDINGLSLSPATDSMRGLHTEADQSRSVLANMVGNSAQDIGALGGVAGTAGMAIGQLAEYATEGGISLGGLAAAAGPMAAVLVASQALAAVMKVFNERAQQAEEDTKAWRDALKSGGDAAGAYARHLVDAGEVIADTSDHVVTFGRVAKEAGGAVTEFGAPVKALIGVFTGFDSGVKDITRLLGEAGITADQWTASVQGGAAAQTTFTAALATTNLSAKEQHELTNALVNSQKDYASATANAAAATKVFGDGVDDTARQLSQAKEAQNDLVRAVATGVDRMNAKWDELRGALDLDQALIDLAGQFDAVKTAGTEAFDAAQAGTDDAAEKMRAYQSATIDAKRQVMDLGEQLGLSLSKTETLKLEVDSGELDRVLQQIEILRRNNDINLNIIARGGAGFGGGGSGSGPRSANPFAAPAATNVTINMPAGSRGVDVVRQIAGQTRRNGRRYGAPVVTYARR